MKHKDDSLEWHDENELVRRLDVVEAVLNLADTIDDVVDVIMSVPTYKVQTSTNIAMGSDSISTKADRKTEPTVDKDINVRSKDEPTTQMKNQNSNLTFEKADEPQTERSE